MRSQLAKLFALITVLLAIAGSAVFAWRQNARSVAKDGKPATAGFLLPSLAGNVRFSHPVHGDARCADCHHPVGGEKLVQRCSHCHRAEGGKLPNAQAAMHQTCIGCHTLLLKAGKSEGLSTFIKV